jgi:hypothetical protein
MPERGIAGIGLQGFQAIRPVKYLVCINVDVSEGTDDQKFLLRALVQANFVGIGARG